MPLLRINIIYLLYFLSVGCLAGPVNDHDDHWLEIKLLTFIIIRGKWGDSYAEVEYEETNTLFGSAKPQELAGLGPALERDHHLGPHPEQQNTKDWVKRGA